MLTKEIKKKERDHPEKVITGYGTCKFCGQQAACKILEDWTKAEKNEAATESCECPEAKWYTAKKEQKERARNRIIMLFGESNGVVSCGETVMELLNNIADEICEGRIKAATINIGDGVKAKLNITSQASIKVERTKTDKSAYEA